MPITYTDKGRLCTEVIQAAGYTIKNRDGVWVTSDDVAVQAIVDAFDEVNDGAKPIKIAELKREAAKRANLIYGFMSGEDEETEPSDVGAFMNFAADLYGSIKPAAQEPLSGRLLQFKNLRDALDTAIGDVNLLTTRNAVETYDIVNTPTWP